MVKIITDSTSYISPTLLQQYDIKIVSLDVLLDNKYVREIDIENKTFYDKLSKLNEIPSSSQPSPEEVYNTFETVLQAGNDVVGIFISSNMSGTYTTALSITSELKEKYPERQIEVIDSKTNCMQLGLIAIQAAKAGMEGKSISEVVSVAQETRKNSRFLFTPETLTYLKKGGRIGKASALLGNLLQIKPVLTVDEDGNTNVYCKVRTKKKAVDTLVEGLMKDLENRKLGDAVVHHINCESEAAFLAAKLEHALGQKVKIQSIGPVIGVHVGPGSIGLAYFTI